MDIHKRMREAVKHFWSTRERQLKKQGESGKKDSGARGSATGGAQMDGFVKVLADAIVECGVPRDCIFTSKGKVVLPGFYRPTKQWDILVVEEGNLLAVIELKSIVGSFGNNFNNRVEESLGSAVDLWRAYKNEQFGVNTRPFAGYFLLVEDAEGSRRKVNLSAPHFDALPEFANTSYQQRFVQLGRKLVLDRHYESVCIIVSERYSGSKGEFNEPDQDLDSDNFVARLKAHIKAYRKVDE